MTDHYAALVECDCGNIWRTYVTNAQASADKIKLTCPKCRAEDDKKIIQVAPDPAPKADDDRMSDELADLLELIDRLKKAVSTIEDSPLVCTHDARKELTKLIDQAYNLAGRQAYNDNYEEIT